jgi:predicted AAA+ superfamily ATPase
LIDISYNYTQSKVKQLRTKKKIFISDTGIANSILKQRKIESFEYLGKLVETQIHNELSKKYETLFWRDKMQHEIDIIVKKNKIVPIEIKYKNSLNSSDNKNMEFFLEKNKSNAIMVTKNILKEENKILYIPAWLFLLSYEKIIS